MFGSDGLLCGMTVVNNYKLTLDTNEIITNNIIPNTVGLLSRYSCKKKLIKNEHSASEWHWRVSCVRSVLSPAPDHTCHTKLAVGFSCLLCGVRAPIPPSILYSLFSLSALNRLLIYRYLYYHS